MQYEACILILNLVYSKDGNNQSSSVALLGYDRKRISHLCYFHFMSMTLNKICNKMVMTILHLTWTYVHNI